MAAPQPSREEGAGKGGTAAPSATRADELRFTAGFLGAWLLLNAIVNSRFPAPEPGAWFLLPSPDVAVLGVALALWEWRTPRPLPAAARAGATALFVLVRVFRVADGVGVRYFNRPLTLDLDLRLLPEFVRLLGATVAAPILVAGTVAALVVLLAVGLLTWGALRRAERYLAHPAHRRWMGALLAAWMVGALLSPVTRPVGAAGAGVIGASVAPRLYREAAFWRRRDGYRQRLRATLDGRQHQLRAGPHDLAGLRHADVYLFLIESYGDTVLTTPSYRRLIAPAYADLQAALAAGGFAVVSSRLDSPTYAGRSWLAQATLFTAARTEDSIGFDLLQEQRPMAMPQFFRDAGYRTIFVQPGTTTPWPKRWSYGFDRAYSAWDLAYQGPPFRWASMPDQYVVDFVHRREVAPTHGPLFAAYALVSSHAPWNEQPPLISNWDLLDGGRVYRRQPPIRYSINWLNLDQAGPAYVRSIVYDLQVLQRYVLEKAPPHALIIVLGDHQPVGDVTGHDPSSAVPIHVFSQDRALIAPFRAMGYVDGMLPDRAQPAAGMETFLPGFVSAFSSRARPPAR